MHKQGEVCVPDELYHKDAQLHKARHPGVQCRLGLGGGMSKVMDTEDLIGDQDLLESGSKAKPVKQEKHGADELLSNMAGTDPLPLGSKASHNAALDSLNLLLI